MPILHAPLQRPSALARLLVGSKRRLVDEYTEKTYHYFDGHIARVDIIDTLSNDSIVPAGKRISKTFVGRMLEAYPNLSMPDSFDAALPLFEEYERKMNKLAKEIESNHKK